MRMLQLHYFKVLAEEQHLTRAAESLFISPPALSTCITRLEKELDFKLFDRAGRNIYLNSNGKIFYKHVKNIFASMDDALCEINKVNSLDKHSINLGVSALTLWSDPITSYYNLHPGVSINHTSLKLDEIQNSEIINRFDLIITALNDINTNEWEYAIVVPKDIPVLVVYPNHPFAKLKEISLIEAKDEPFIALTKGYSSRKYFDETCELAGFTPRIIVEGDYPLRTQMVEAGYGITFSTVIGSKAPILKGLKYVEIKSPQNIRVQAIFWRKGRKLSPEAKSFQNFMINYYKDYQAIL